MEKRLPLKDAKNIVIKRSLILGVLAIILCWFVKLIGFDLFRLDMNNDFFNDLSDFITSRHWITQIWYIITLNIQVYLLYGIVNKEKGWSAIKYTLITLPLSVVVKLCSNFITISSLKAIIEILYLILIISKFNYKKMIKSLLVMALYTLYQIISLNMRSINLKAHTYGFMAEQILSIDLYIMLILTREVKLMENGTWVFFGITSWLYAVAGFVVGLFTLHPIKKAKEYYAKGKEKENARKTKKASK